MLTTPDPNETYLGVSETARRLCLGKRTVRRLLDETDLLSGFKVPDTKYRKVSVSSIEAYERGMRDASGQTD